MATRYVSVIGLGFGDCGKGRFVDELYPRLVARTVVRYNGGAQAGHNVMTEDGRHHVFSSFGAATFHPGAATLLAYPVVVHPTGLLREAEVLREKGVPDALERLAIDARCRITTPFLQAAGRLRELAREKVHGSCGIGFGETVKLSLEAPELGLSYADLLQPRRCREKLEAQREYLPHTLGEVPDHAGTRHEWRCFAEPGLAERWLELAVPLARALPPAGREEIAARLRQHGAVLFEGAQGMLLDEDHGFHPHTTWSRVGPAAAEAVLRDAGIGEEMLHLGALRTYATRHGQGPLPTADAALDRLEEPHNPSSGWQGRFRRGHPDLVLLHYALAAANSISGLLVSHLDAPARLAEGGGGLRFCTAYKTAEGSFGELPPAKGSDLGHQERLKDLLAGAEPVYEGLPCGDQRTFLGTIAALFPRQPALLGSYGPRRGQADQLRPLPF